MNRMLIASLLVVGFAASIAQADERYKIYDDRGMLQGERIVDKFGYVKDYDIGGRLIDEHQVIRQGDRHKVYDDRGQLIEEYRKTK